MPQGKVGTRKVAADIAARRASGANQAGTGVWFKLQPDKDAIVRFVEDADSYEWAMFHEVPRSDRSYGDLVVCLDQDEEGERQGDPCPGCDADLKRSYKGFIRVIWRDAPVYKRNNEGRIVKDQMGDPVVVGRSDQVALWTSGINLFTNLDEIDENYRGLNRREFKVKREGEGMNTKYHIHPLTDPNTGDTIPATPLSEEDEKLIESSTLDLSKFTKAPTYEEFAKMIKQQGMKGGFQQSNGEQSAAELPNPFMRR